jgi:hypothetical protein
MSERLMAKAKVQLKDKPQTKGAQTKSAKDSKAKIQLKPAAKESVKEKVKVAPKAPAKVQLKPPMKEAAKPQVAAKSAVSAKVQLKAPLAARGKDPKDLAKDPKAAAAASAAAGANEPGEKEAVLPLLDLSDAAVKKMIKQAKKRGYVTFDQLNEVLPSDSTSPEQIEDIMAMLSDMGINVTEQEESSEEEEKAEDDDDETDGELVEVTQKAVTEVKKSEPGERTDDPVRMYLREMGSVELLSREGEIAIAKRIEAGREAMIAGLCESPLTFQAIIIWRDELNTGKIFLRDIIDLEATYAGPDAKNNMNPAMNPAMNGGAPGEMLRRCRPRHLSLSVRPRMPRPPISHPLPHRRQRRRSVPLRQQAEWLAPRPVWTVRRRTRPRLPPKPTWTTTSSRTRCRSPPSRPS